MSLICLNNPSSGVNVPNESSKLSELIYFDTPDKCSTKVVEYYLKGEIVQTKPTKKDRLTKSSGSDDSSC